MDLTYLNAHVYDHGTCNTSISSEHKNTSRPTCTLMDTVDNTACGSESSNHGTCNTNTCTLMDVGYSDFKNDNTVIACDLECSNDGTYNANNT